jgi:phosphate-selective porin OprO and OprP
MIRIVVALCLSLGAFKPAHATDAPRPPLSAHHNGVDYGLSGLMQYDIARFDGRHSPRDREDWRRATIGVYVRKQGAFGAVADYDFKARAWLDSYLRVESSVGALRLGQFRTPVGLDSGATSSGSTVFLERALPEAAMHQGRRLGLDWTHAQSERYRFNLGIYSGGDLAGRHKGHSIGGKAVFLPRNDIDDVLHLGFSASREERDDRIARLNSKP